MWWVKWLKTMVGQGYIFYVIFPVKEPSHSSMLEAKLWHIKTETKNVKVAKICDQYPRGFNFGDFFQLYNNFEIGDRGTSVHLD